jgi:hypothetical protein
MGAPRIPRLGVQVASLALSGLAGAVLSPLLLGVAQWVAGHATHATFTTGALALLLWRALVALVARGLDRAGKASSAGRSSR